MGKYTLLKAKNFHRRQNIWSKSKTFKMILFHCKTFIKRNKYTKSNCFFAQNLTIADIKSSLLFKTVIKTTIFNTVYLITEIS